MKRIFRQIGAAVLTGAMLCGMSAGAFAAGDVAKINSTGYRTLNKALEAVKNGQTIVLLQNVSSSTESYWGGEGKGVAYIHESASAKSFTIDLNGKKITASGNADDALLIAADEGAGNLSVTLKNGTISASGTEVDSICVMDLDSSTPTTVTLRNMTVSADGEAGINCFGANLDVQANVTGVGDAICAEDSTINLLAGSFNATGTDSNDGAIASYLWIDDENMTLDMSRVTTAGEPAIVRPADWKTTLPMSLWVTNFQDVQPGADGKNPWYYDYVYEMANRGVVSGDGNVWTFSPAKNVTREQFAVMLASAAGADLSAYENKKTFSDVTHAWSVRQIEWAYDNGIVSGTGNGKFAPTASITRQEVCVMLYKYQANILNIEPRQVVEVPVYPDGDQVATWAETAVQTMLMEGIISGSKDKDTVKLLPKGNATRAQICTMLSAMFKFAAQS